MTVTSTALVYNTVAEENKLFSEDYVKINLNNGVPVISDPNHRFEPGMTVVKDFFIQNESNCEVYYKLYFSDIEGELQDVLDITVKDGDTVLYSGKMTELIRAKTKAIPTALTAGERKDLTVSFHFPQFAGNETASRRLKFSFCADAVQADGNPDRLF